MNNVEHVYDVIGIGFGPANIAVACAMEESDFKHSVLFLEAKEKASWQENMLFESSDIQNHPLRDLVTPRNPRSKYSFTNFLFVHGRLFEHFNVGMALPFREEYAQYIGWVASHFGDLVKYKTKVKSMGVIQGNNNGRIYKVTTDDGTYFSKSIILAPGRTPNIPSEFKDVASDRVVFLSNYLSKLSEFKPGELRKVAVVGGSQSAVEIILHFSDNYPDADIAGFTRKFGFLQKDVNPFTGEVYFPEFVDLFYKSNQQNKNRLINDLYLTNYSASDADVLDRLYQKMYLQKIRSKSKIVIHRSSNITDVSLSTDGKVRLGFDKVESETKLTESFDLVILATGFKNTGIRESEERLHPLLIEFQDALELDNENCAVINYNYSLKFKDQQINSFFLNGLCESSHGMGDAGSFSLLALRSMTIVESLDATLRGKKKNTDLVKSLVNV